MRRGSTENTLIAGAILALMLVAGVSYLLTPGKLWNGGIKGGDVASLRNSPPPPPSTDHNGTRPESASANPASFGTQVVSEKSSLPPFQPETFKSPTPLPDGFFEDGEQAEDSSEGASASSTPVDDGNEQVEWVMPEILQKSPGIDLNECDRQSPRTWTSSDGSKTVEASLWGVDHVTQKAMLKIAGKPAKQFDWDKFSDADKDYLADRCLVELRTMKFEEAQQREISRQRLVKRAIGNAKARARTAAAANAAAATAAAARHDIRYKTDPAYRRDYDRNYGSHRYRRVPGCGCVYCRL